MSSRTPGLRPLLLWSAIFGPLWIQILNEFSITLWIRRAETRSPWSFPPELTIPPRIGSWRWLWYICFAVIPTAGRRVVASVCIWAQQLWMSYPTEEPHGSVGLFTSTPPPLPTGFYRSLQKCSITCEKYWCLLRQSILVVQVLLRFMDTLKYHPFQMGKEGWRRNYDTFLRVPEENISFQKNVRLNKENYVVNSFAIRLVSNILLGRTSQGELEK
jgi:hypothetical protein